MFLMELLKAIYEIAWVDHSAVTVLIPPTHYLLLRFLVDVRNELKHRLSHIV